MQHFKVRANTENSHVISISAESFNDALGIVYGEYHFKEITDKNDIDSNIWDVMAQTDTETKYFIVPFG